MGKLRLANKEVTRDWLRRRVQFYAQRAGLDYRPRVAWSVEACVTLGGDHGNKRVRLMDKKTRATAHPDKKIICIRLDNHLVESTNGEVAYLSRADADDTAAHEVCHLRWPAMGHSDLFKKRVLALRAGERCTPFGKRGLPEAFK